MLCLMATGDKRLRGANLLGVPISMVVAVAVAMGVRLYFTHFITLNSVTLLPWGKFLSNLFNHSEFGGGSRRGNEDKISS